MVSTMTYCNLPCVKRHAEGAKGEGAPRVHGVVLRVRIYRNPREPERNTQMICYFTLELTLSHLVSYYYHSLRQKLLHKTEVESRESVSWKVHKYLLSFRLEPSGADRLSLRGNSRRVRGFRHGRVGAELPALLWDF